MAGPIDDLALARTLLGGFYKNGYHHYLDPGDEGRARKALVRELLIAKWVETRMEGSSISVEGAMAEAADKFSLAYETIKNARKRARTIIAM